MEKHQVTSAHDPGIAVFEQRQDFLGSPLDGWYWRDDACEEWMGPFATLREAQADHEQLRAAPSSSSGKNL